MSVVNKLSALQSCIKEIAGKEAVLAFSGGVDSTLLLKVSYDLLKSRLIAITVKTPFCSKHELEYASALLRK